MYKKMPLLSTLCVSVCFFLLGCFRKDILNRGEFSLDFIFLSISIINNNNDNNSPATAITMPNVNVQLISSFTCFLSGANARARPTQRLFLWLIAILAVRIIAGYAPLLSACKVAPMSLRMLSPLLRLFFDYFCQLFFCCCCMR